MSPARSYSHRLCSTPQQYSTASDFVFSGKRPREDATPIKVDDSGDEERVAKKPKKRRKSEGKGQDSGVEEEVTKKPKKKTKTVEPGTESEDEEEVVKKQKKRHKSEERSEKKQKKAKHSE